MLYDTDSFTDFYSQSYTGTCGPFWCPNGEATCLRRGLKSLRMGHQSPSSSILLSHWVRHEFCTREPKLDRMEIEAQVCRSSEPCYSANVAERLSAVECIVEVSIRFNSFFKSGDSHAKDGWNRELCETRSFRAADLATLSQAPLKLFSPTHGRHIQI